MADVAHRSWGPNEKLRVITLVKPIPSTQMAHKWYTATRTAGSSGFGFTILRHQRRTPCGDQNLCHMEEHLQLPAILVHKVIYNLVGGFNPLKNISQLV